MSVAETAPFDIDVCAATRRVADDGTRLCNICDDPHTARGLCTRGTVAAARHDGYTQRHRVFG